MMTMLVKARWEKDGIKEDTCETKTQMKIDYLEIFFLGWYWTVVSSGSAQDLNLKTNSL